MNGLPSFQSTPSFIGKIDIPYIRPGGLIHWLLVCDLVEFGFCLPPMGLDLVQKLGGVPIQCSVKAKGGNGAIQAFEQIQEETGIQMTYSTSEALEESLDLIVQ